MSQEVISFIGVSYEELKSIPIDKLEEEITKNIQPYFERIYQMDLDEKIKLREDVKQTRKEKFRFSQDITKDIPKERIQLALSHLAKLFRRLDDEIKNSNRSKQGLDGIL